MTSTFRAVGGLDYLPQATAQSKKSQGGGRYGPAWPVDPDGNDPIPALRERLKSMTAFPSYSTGTVSVAANATAVVGVGTAWAGINARAGDDLVIAGHTVTVIDVTDTTHLLLPMALYRGDCRRRLQNHLAIAAALCRWPSHGRR